MSWIRSSESTALVVLLVLSLAAVGPAAAFSVSVENVPAEAQVGEEVSVTITIDDPFDGQPNTWTLDAETELENVSWTITILDQGSQVDQVVSGEQTVKRELQRDNGGDEVRIELTGETPGIDNYSYETKERFTLFTVTQVTGNNEKVLQTNETHHYTNESKEAREKIDAARDTINETGGSSEAEEQLDRAIEAYNAESFDNAISLAEDAKSKAESAQQSSQTLQLALMVGGAVLLVLLVVGGIYYWRSQQDSYDKLQ